MVLPDLGGVDRESGNRDFQGTRTLGDTFSSSQTGGFTSVDASVDTRVRSVSGGSGVSFLMITTPSNTCTQTDRDPF